MHGPTPPLPRPTDQLRFAMPPMHESMDDERRHRKERLAGALRLFGRLGFEDGVSGHITARDPEFSDCFWVNPFGMPFKHVTVSDLVMANAGGPGRRGPLPRQPGRVRRARPGPRAPAPTSSPSPTATPCTAGPSPPSVSCSTRSPRRPAPSTRTTRLRRLHRASPSTRRRAGGSRPRSGRTRRWSCATTGC